MIAAEVGTGKRDHIEVTGSDFETPDGTGIGDHIHVTDPAGAHLATLDLLIAQPQESVTFNVGYGRGASVLGVLEAVDRVSAQKIRRVHAVRRPGDFARLVADIQQISNRLGWRPPFDELDRIVADVTAWERRLAARKSTN
jgi:UDP-glucose 4-epimerase